MGPNPGSGAPPGKVAASVKQFLAKTYWSIAETLPHEQLGKCKLHNSFRVATWQPNQVRYWKGGL